MGKWISFLQMYDKNLTEIVLVIMGLIFIIILLRILRQIKRLNRSLSGITKNIQAYFDVIMQEEPQEQGEEQTQEAQASQEILPGSHTERGESAVEQEYRKQEEEKVFNAVLQEYFS